nr:MAG TPA: hypothetical protein [Caudoviricetes sp.]
MNQSVQQGIYFCLNSVVMYPAAVKLSSRS